MVIIYGSKLYGKVDVVPGLFHVETRFGHIYYLPLIPLGSFVVFGKSGDNFNGVKIPMSFKSILYAWLRAGTLMAGIISLFVVVLEWGTNPSTAMTAGIVAASSLATSAVLSFHKGSTNASYQRALELGEKIGLTPEGMALIEQHFNARVEQPADPFAQETDRFNADL